MMPVIRITFFILIFLIPLYGGSKVKSDEIQYPKKNQPDEITTFSVFELNLEAKNPGKNSYTEGPALSAIFTDPDNRTYMVKGFWNGENIFSIRFSPQKAGIWTYTTSSSDPGLNAIRGSFTAVEPDEMELRQNILSHGFLKPEGYGWKLSDGTPFLPVGETQWSFTEEFHTGEWKDWVSVLKERGYNSFLGCIWLGKYPRAGITPFKGSPAGDMLNEAFFDRLDEWIEFANDHGIIMGLTIGGFPDNSRWFALFNKKERNDRWFQYCVRRYAAYHVRWVLYGEVDEVNPPWATWEENAEAMARLVKDEDPYDHPVGSHHRYIDRATARSSGIDFLCIQSNRNAFGRMNAEYQYLTTKDYRQYGKPLWFEEYWYENMEGQTPGIHNTYRNFIAGLAFPTMGSLMRAHEPERRFVPERAKEAGLSVYDYLLERDTGMMYMQHFAEFFTSAGFLDFSPAPDKIKDSGLTRQCGRFGNSYVIFKMNGGPVQLDMTNASGKFSVEKMEIKTGKRSKLPDISPGGWRTIDSEDTTGVVFLIQEGNIPKPPVLNAPVEGVEFTPGEKVYFMSEGELSSFKVKLMEGQKSSRLFIDSLSSTFIIPMEVAAGGQVKITLGNRWGKVEQMHKIIATRKNRPPVLTRTIADVFSGEPVGIQLGFSDPDGPGPYNFTIVKSPANGELTGSGNDRIYRSNPHFVGTDQFTWLVNDGIDDAKKEVTVIIHVKKNNQKMY